MQEQQLLAEGNTAWLYRRQECVVKVLKPGFSAQLAQAEAANQRQALTLGLPVPEIYAVGEQDGRPALIMQYLPGLSLAEQALQDRANLEQYLRETVRLQLRLHALTVANFTPLAERLRWAIREAEQLSESQRQVLLADLTALPAGDRLCHGDFHPLNLIRQADGGLVILDWCDATAGDSAADACRSYLIYLQTDAALAALYLRLYCRESGLPVGQVLAWLPVLAAARLREGLGEETQRQLLAIIKKAHP